MRTARGPFSGLPAAFWKLWVATLVNRLGGFVVPFLSLFLGSAKEMSASTIGTIVGCFGAGSMVAGPLGGALADRVGRRFTVLLGMSASAAAMLLVAAASGKAELAIACFVLGLATELPRPATNALIADLVPAEDRARAFNALYWAANLGFACASLLAGAVATVSFTWLFVLDALTCLACAAIVAVGVPEPTRSSSDKPKFTIADLGVPFRDVSFAWFFAASVLVALVFFQFHVAMPLDMKAHGITNAQYGLLIALNGVLVIALQPFAPRLLGGLGSGKALALGAVLVGIGFGALAFADTPLGYAVAIAIFTLGEVAMAPVNPTVVSALAPPALRGTYQGAYQLTWSIAACAGPLLGGTVLETLGGPTLWIGCAVVATAAAILHVGIDGPRRARLAVASLTQ